MPDHHRIIVDRAGFEGWARYTDADHHEVVGATCLRQSWMSDAEWIARRDAWLTEHDAGADVRRIL